MERDVTERARGVSLLVSLPGPEGAARLALLPLVAMLAFGPGVAAAALTAPEPFVSGPDGARQTLEQAGILKADGRRWAIVLGKALFWDEQVGSDGQCLRELPLRRRSRRADPEPAVARASTGVATAGRRRRSAPGQLRGRAAAARPVGHAVRRRRPTGLHAPARRLPTAPLDDERDRNSPIVRPPTTRCRRRARSTRVPRGPVGSTETTGAGRPTAASSTPAGSPRARSSRATPRPRSTRSSCSATSGTAAPTTCSTASASSACATSRAIRRSG